MFSCFIFPCVYMVFVLYFLFWYHLTTSRVGESAGSLREAFDRAMSFARPKAVPRAPSSGARAAYAAYAPAERAQPYTPGLLFCE